MAESFLRFLRHPTMSDEEIEREASADLLNGCLTYLAKADGTYEYVPHGSIIMDGPKGCKIGPRIERPQE